MQSRIGRSQAGGIELDAAGDLQVGEPAIYLRGSELLSVKTEPADVGTALPRCLPTFNQSSPVPLPDPVYRLDGSRQNEARDQGEGRSPQGGAGPTGHPPPLQTDVTPAAAPSLFTPPGAVFSSQAPPLAPHNAHHSHLDSHEASIIKSTIW